MFNKRWGLGTPVEGSFVLLQLWGIAAQHRSAIFGVWEGNRRAPQTPVPGSRWANCMLWRAWLPRGRSETGCRGKWVTYCWLGHPGITVLAGCGWILLTSWLLCRTPHHISVLSLSDQKQNKLQTGLISTGRMSSPLVGPGRRGEQSALGMAAERWLWDVRPQPMLPSARALWAALQQLSCSCKKVLCSYWTPTCYKADEQPWDDAAQAADGTEVEVGQGVPGVCQQRPEEMWHERERKQLMMAAANGDAWARLKSQR